MTNSKDATAEPLPIHSMTGFVRITGSMSGGVTWTLTLKSVNHRFLDLHFRMPPHAESVEMRLRRLLKEKIVRGHLEVTLTFDRGDRMSVSFDRNLIAAYIDAFRAATAENSITQQPDMNAIFRMPGVLTGESRFSAEEMSVLEQAVAAQIEPLITGLNEMRSNEGRSLARELFAGLDRLGDYVDQIAPLRQDVQRSYFERIQQRISGLLDGSVDSDRILQEAAMLAERSDIDEEVTRLRTHIQHFQSLLRSGGEIGKKLDFLLQEMNREANTLLSKTGGVSGNGQRITEMGLGMKSEIEKAREQVQNLE